MIRILRALIGSILQTSITLLKAIFATSFTLLTILLFVPFAFVKTLAQTLNHLTHFRLKDASFSALTLPFAALLIPALSIALLLTFSYMAIITAPLVGALNGWDESLSSLLKRQLREPYQGIVKTFRYLNVWRNQEATPESLKYLFFIFFILVHRLFLSSRNEENEANMWESTYLFKQNEAQDNIPPFESLAFSEEEVAEINKEPPPPLTEEELKSAANMNLSLLEAYNCLLDRLDTNCIIIMDKPEEIDAILLVKQQKISGKWQHVPGGSTVFGKEGLNHWYNEKHTHPTCREQLYEGAVENIRFKFHPLYNEKGEVMSQELNDLIVKIRQKILNSSPTNQKHRVAFPTNNYYLNGLLSTFGIYYRNNACNNVMAEDIQDVENTDENRNNLS